MFKFNHKAFEEWLKNDYWPLMGADGEGEGEGEGTGDAGEGSGSGDSGEGSGEGNSEGSGSGEGSGEGDGEGDGEGSSDAEDDELTRLRNHSESQRRELAAAQNALTKAKAEARKAREEAAKKGGNWEQVAKERASEIEDLNERLTTAERERLTAVENLDTFQREVRVTRLATRMGFRDPQDAIRLLSSDVTGDDKTAERALRNLAKEKDYLVDSRRPRGRGMGNGAGGSDLFTKEQLETMSTQDIIANMEKVQRSQAAIGPRSSSG